MKLHSSLGLAACLVLAAMTYPTPARAVVIDDFEVGDFSLTDDVLDSDGAELIQPGLPTGNVISGRRTTSVELLTPEAIGIPNAITASLATTAGLNNDSMTISSISRAVGHLEMEWFGITQALEDLTEGGTHDRFLIDIPTADTAFSLAMIVRTKVSTSQTNGSVSPLMTVTGPGTVHVPFDSFVPTSSSLDPADFTEVDSIFIVLSTANMPTDPWTIEISQITTGIPEPTSMAFVIPASLAWLGQRPRRPRPRPRRGTHPRNHRPRC